LGRPAEALEYAERARAQNLVSFLAGRDVEPNPSVPPELVERFRRARDEQRRLDLAAAPESQRPRPRGRPSAACRRPGRPRGRGDRLERQVSEVTRALEEIGPHDPASPHLFRVEPIRFDEVVRLLPRDAPTALVEFVVTEEGTLALVAVPGDSPSALAVHLPAL